MTRKGLQPGNKINTDGAQLFNVPCTGEGLLFRNLCHKFRNKGCQYQLRFRGRGHRANKAEEQSIPLSKSQWMAGYVLPDIRPLQAQVEWQAERLNWLQTEAKRLQEEAAGNLAAANRGLEKTRKLDSKLIEALKQGLQWKEAFERSQDDIQVLRKQLAEAKTSIGELVRHREAERDRVRVLEEQLRTADDLMKRSIVQLEKTKPQLEIDGAREIPGSLEVCSERGITITINVK